MAGLSLSASQRFRARYGPWAVVAGASEGIGASFASALAARGLNLVLIARRAEPLQAQAAVLMQRHGVQTRVLPLDLGAHDLAARLTEGVADLEVGLLVANAALALMGPFASIALSEQLRAIDVNCRAPVVLAHVFAPAMQRRGRGGIIVMSSLSALYSGPYVATYAASKAFDCILAESLAGELGPFGVDVTACVAGTTRTPTYDRQSAKGPPPMRPEQVVNETLRALQRRRPRVIPGLLNRLSAYTLGHLPRVWLVRLIARILAPASTV